MNTHSKPNIEENINIKEALKDFWDRKIILFISVSISILFSFVYISYADFHYESYFKYSTNFRIPLMQDDGSNNAFINNKFPNLFYDKNLFNKWKVVFPNSKLSFDDISPDGKNIVEFDTETDRQIRTVKIRSNDKVLINDIYSFSQFINQSLTSQLNRLIKQNQDSLEEYLKALRDKSPGNDITNFVLLKFKLEYYLNYLDSDNLLYISTPSKPKVLGLSKELIIASSIFLAIFFGTILILIINMLKRSNA